MQPPWLCLADDHRHQSAASKAIMVHSVVRVVCSVCRVGPRWRFPAAGLRLRPLLLGVLPKNGRAGQCSIPNRRSRSTAAITSKATVIVLPSARPARDVGRDLPPVTPAATDRNPPRRELIAPPPPFRTAPLRRLRPIRHATFPTGV